MSTEQYDFFSLDEKDGNEDKKEPLLYENLLLRNDFTNLLEGDKFISTIKNRRNWSLKDNQNQQNASIDEESSPIENNLDLRKKQQDNTLKK